MQQPNFGWLIPGFGFCCYRKCEDKTEIYGLFTPGGKFIRHLTQQEANERHFGSLPKMQKFNSVTRVNGAYYPVP